MKQIIQSRGRNIVIEGFTGKVVEHGKDREVKVSGSGGGGYSSYGSGYTNPVSIRSETTIHDSIFLINKNGEERDFQFKNYDIAVRKDHIVTVLYCYEEGMNNKAQVFAACNNSLKKDFVDRKTVREISYWGSDSNRSKLGCLFVFALMILGIYFCFKWPILGLAVFGFIGYKAYESYKLANDFEKKIEWPNVELW